MSLPELVTTGGQQLLDTKDRGNFIKSTYLHLCAAILCFAVICAALKTSGISSLMLRALSGFKFAWMGVLGAFMLIGWLASSLADTAQNRGTQLTGLTIAVVAESLIFAPMLAMADALAPGAISSAAVATLALIGGLTYVAFTSKQDFTVLGGVLKVGSFVALGLIIASILMGFKLGVWFSGAMIVFASGAILYDTAQIIRHHPIDRPVGAALHLFSSFALLFWYMLRILMDLATED